MKHCDACGQSLPEPPQPPWIGTNDYAIEPCDQNEDGAHIVRLNGKMQWCRLVRKWTNGNEDVWGPLENAF